jgi:hypothetical protein
MLASAKVDGRQFVSTPTAKTVTITPAAPPAAFQLNPARSAVCKRGFAKRLKQVASI